MLKHQLKLGFTAKLLFENFVKLSVQCNLNWWCTVVIYKFNKNTRKELRSLKIRQIGIKLSLDLTLLWVATESDGLTALENL